MVNSLNVELVYLHRIPEVVVCDGEKPSAEHQSTVCVDRR